MQEPPTPRFAQAVESSRTVTSRVEMLVDGRPVMDLPPLLIDGSISMARQLVRTTASLTVTDPRGVLAPADAAAMVELLQPVDGHELRIWWGIQFPDEPTPQEVPVATLVITELAGDWPSLSLQARDRLWLVTDRRGRFRTMTQVAAGTNYATAITGILQATAATGLPDRVPVEITATSQTTPLLTFDAQASRGEEASKLAQALGWVLYADRLGRVTTIPEPDLAAAPLAARLVDWQPADQALGGTVLLGASPKLSAEDTTNVMIVDAESTGGTPWHAEAADTDPESATYTGTFGEHVEFMSNPLLTSQAMADAAARTALRNRLGLGSTVNAEIVSNWLLDPGDVVYLRRAAVGVDGRFMLDSLSGTLRGGRMQVTTRDVRAVIDDAS